MDSATWIALTPHQANLLREAGADVRLLDEVRTEHVSGRRVVIAPSSARGEDGVLAAARRLQTLGADVYVVDKEALGGALDLADLLELRAAEGKQVDLTALAKSA